MRLDPRHAEVPPARKVLRGSRLKLTGPLTASAAGTLGLLRGVSASVRGNMLTGINSGTETGCGSTLQIRMRPTVWLSTADSGKTIGPHHNFPGEMSPHNHAENRQVEPMSGAILLVIVCLFQLSFGSRVRRLQKRMPSSSPMAAVSAPYSPSKSHVPPVSVVRVSNTCSMKTL